jgi:DNA (cytosine-5)-methyltransferase 1
MVENKDKKYNSDKQWELVNFCEFDKYATKSYCAIHNVDESLNLGDITKVDETDLDDFNMMTWGFPCTDISVAGKQKGFIDEDGEKTRSGMYYEGIRILREKKPALSIIENVKNFTGKRFKNEFEMVLSDLDDAGYNTYYQVLNAKNYGVPQNRERVFIISIRKDLDNGKFKFPEPFDNGLRLKDLLEDEVDEKFYISDEKVERFITNAKENKYCNKKANFTPELWKSCYAIRSQEFVRTGFTDDCSTLTARDYKDPRCVVVHKNEETNIVKQVGNISDCNGNWNNPQVGRVYDVSGCSPTLNTCSGGGHEPKVITGIDKSYNNPKFIEIDNCITSREDRGISNRKSEGTAVLKIGNINPSGNGMNGSVYSEEGLSPTLTTNKGEGNKVAIKQATKQGYIECEVGGVADLSYPDSKTRRGRVQDNGNISPTITATETGICRIESPIRIRKLTPKECFRLMGFSDENFDAAQKVGISNSQLYKQAGNSIVVDVLYYIYVELYKAMPYLFDDLKLSSFFSGIGAFEIALDKLYKDINSGNFINPQTE